MSLPTLPDNPTDAQLVATFRAATLVFREKMQRAWAGLCINLAGTFLAASNTLRAVADAIEGVPTASGDGQSRPVVELYEAAQRALECVAGRLTLQELPAYIAELEYRRTGVRPACQDVSVDKTERKPARYYIAELVATVAPIPWKIEVDDRKTALEWFAERARFHQVAFGAVPMVLVDRKRGVVIRSRGDVSGFDARG